SVENESDHLVRYRSIRALGRVAADTRLRMDRARVERQAYIDLTVHFEVLACRVALDVAIPQTEPADARRRQVTGILLRGLLDDKLRHSIERTFRLLKIAHATEDIHRVQIACLSDDLHSRANAGEFLDALLVRRDQQRLRALLRLISDSLSPAAARRSRTTRLFASWSTERTPRSRPSRPSTPSPREGFRSWWSTRPAPAAPTSTSWRRGSSKTTATTTRTPWRRGLRFPPRRTPTGGAMADDPRLARLTRELFFVAATLGSGDGLPAWVVDRVTSLFDEMGVVEGQVIF